MMLFPFTSALAEVNGSRQRRPERTVVVSSDEVNLVESSRSTAGPPKDYTATNGLSQPRYDTIRESVNVKMKDGIEIYLEVVRPKAKGRFGTIIELSPYHGTLYERSGNRTLMGPVDEHGNHIGLAGYFAPRGYAVVFADLRGTGRSEGCAELMGPKDRSDAYEIVEWAAQQDWSNGRVGMTGHSWPGSTPQMAASENPPHLVTIAPSAGTAAVYHVQFQNGVPYNPTWGATVWFQPWLATQRHLPPGANGPYGATGDNFGNDMEYFGCGWKNSSATAGEANFSGHETEWYEQRDFRRGAAAADIPVFIVHGVNDERARIAAIDWFNWREGRRGDKAWIGQWDHGVGCCPNTRTCSYAVAKPCEDDEWTAALHAWFDRHLLGRKVDTGPPVEVFLNNGSVLTAREWPPPAKTVRFFADRDGGLATTRADDGEASYVADPRGAVNESDTGHVSFETEPLKEDMLIVGVPEMVLAASSTSPRIHINATLYDIAAEEQPDRIGRVAWAIQPELRDGWDDPQPVMPGQRMQIKLEGMSLAHLVKKGHRIRLVIASSHPDKYPFFAAGSRVTIYVGGKDGTQFTLPVVERPKLYPDHLVQQESG